MRNMWGDAGAGVHSLPTEAEAKALERLAPVSYAAGGMTALAAALAPGGHAPTLVALAMTALVIAGIGHRARRHVGYRFAVATNAFGSVLIAAAVVAGGGGGASAFSGAIYVLVALHAALALHRRHGLALAAWAAVTAVVATRVSNPDINPLIVLAVFVLVCGTVLAATNALVRRLRVQTTTDPLTGAGNRPASYAAFERARARADRLGQPLSVVFLDLDGFKRVNDTRGHAAGDRVLAAAADAWRGVLRPDDLLARFGGDEFCVLLPGVPAHEARNVAARLMDAMPADTTCSAGVATRAPGETADALMARADAALYREKERRAPPAVA